MSATKITLLISTLMAARSLAAEPAALNGILTTGDVVTISLSKPVDYKLSVLRNPDRLVVDLPGAVLTSAQLEMDGEGRAVRHISSRRAKGGARVIVELREMTPGRLDWDRGNLSIHFTSENSLAALIPVETDLKDAVSGSAGPQPRSSQGAARSNAEDAGGDDVTVSGRLSDRAGKPMVGNFLLHFEAHDAYSSESVWQKNQYVASKDGSFKSGLSLPREIESGLRSGMYKVSAHAPEGTDWTVKAAAPSIGRANRLALRR